MSNEKTYNSQEAQEIARFMISYLQLKLPGQMLARGETPSAELCELVRVKYEQEVPKDIRMAVDDLEQVIGNGQ